MVDNPLSTLQIADRLTVGTFLEALLDSPIIPNIHIGELISNNIVITRNGNQLQVSNLGAKIGDIVITHEVR